MGDLLSIQWVPSHVEIFGNEEAARLAKDRCRHASYTVEWVAKIRVEQDKVMTELGLQAMPENSDGSEISGASGTEGTRTEQGPQGGCGSAGGTFLTI